MSSVSRLILLGASLATAGIIGEIGARIYFAVSPHWRDDPRSRFLIPNELFSHWHPPSFNGRNGSQAGEFDVLFTTNSFGMVDRERELEKAGVTRIALLGDSFVEGLQVDIGQRFGDLLEQRLNLTRGSVEVLNFGVSWYSPQLELAIYRHLVRRFHPNLTILFVHFTDVTDDWRFKDQAIVGERGDLRRVRQNPTLTRVQSPVGDFVRRSSIIRLVYWTWLAKHSTSPPDSSLKDTFMAWFKPTLNQDDFSAMDLTKSNILQLVEVIRRDGGEIILCPLPIAEFVGCEGPKGSRFLPKGVSQSDIRNAERFYDWLREMSVEVGLKYADLVPAFRAACRSSDQRLFHQIDGHFTASGHSVVASELAGLLNDLGRSE